MTTITGNIARDLFLKAAILRLKAETGHDPNLMMVQTALPPDFDLDGQELGGARRAMREAPETIEQVEAQIAALSESLENIAPHANGTAPSDDDAADTTPEATTEDQATQAEVIAAMRVVKDTLAIAQRTVYKLQQETRYSRTALSQAIRRWQNGGVIYTDSQMRRDFLAGEAIKRHARAAGRMEHQGDQPRQLGNTYFDRVGKYGKGDSTTFARAPHNAGQPFRGGQRHARGDVFDRSTGKIRARLPSEG